MLRRTAPLVRSALRRQATSVSAGQREFFVRQISSSTPASQDGAPAGTSEKTGDQPSSKVKESRPRERTSAPKRQGENTRAKSGTTSSRLSSIIAAAQGGDAQRAMPQGTGNRPRRVSKEEDETKKARPARPKSSKAPTAANAASPRSRKAEREDLHGEDGDKRKGKKPGRQQQRTGGRTEAQADTETSGSSRTSSSLVTSGNARFRSRNLRDSRTPQHIPVPVVLPHLSTDWDDALRQSPNSLRGNGLVQAQPPSAPRFPGMGNISKDAGEGPLKAVVVPPHLRHKQAVHLLTVKVPAQSGSVARPGWQLQLPSQGVSSGVPSGSSTELVAQSGNNELTSKLTGQRQQIIAETVGGAYERYVGATSEQVKQASSKSTAERVVTVAKHATGQNPSISAAGKAFIGQEIAEKLKQMRV